MTEKNLEEQKVTLASIQKRQDRMCMLIAAVGFTGLVISTNAAIQECSLPLGIAMTGSALVLLSSIHVLIKNINK